MTTMRTMTKADAISAIKEFKQKILDFAYNVSDDTIEKCVYMVDEMTIVPHIRPIIDDDMYGYGIAFDYDEDKYGLFVEIFVADEGVYGYTSYKDEENSNFEFENVEDAINFWNVVIGKFVKG